MKIKESILDLYRKEWLDIAAHVFISALVNLRTITVDGEETQVHISAAEAIKRFQKWLNLTEDDIDTDAVKSIYYRNQVRLMAALKTDRKNLKIEADPNDERMKEMIKSAVLEALTTLKQNPKLASKADVGQLQNENN